jgi:epoxyqueuosine reductase
MTDPRQEELRRRLFALGFDDVRFASAPQPMASETLRDWLGAGRHADMAWMERSAEKRLNADLVLPGVKSVILLGVSYAADPPRPAGGSAAPENPVWARYALHEDYHDTMKPGLVAAGHALEELFGVAGTDYRYYVDTGPVLERSWAARAGVGFLGKNAMLISRTHGNWLFLAAILTRLELMPDAPIEKKIARREGAERAQGGIGLLCGSCTRCLDACPTQAFTAPGVVDARRCISYQTIENKGVIPRELRAGIGARIYGCDVCLEVCPWNRFARAGRAVLLASRHDLADLSLREVLELTPERFAAVFRKTAIKRLKLAGLLRNACVVAGNLRDAGVLPQLVALAAHEKPLVRAHAVWAVFRVAGQERAMELLADARARESDADVLAEYTAG